jgi:DNA-binding XRE family transcriptional regulator
MSADLTARERRFLLAITTDDIYWHGQIDLDRIAHLYLQGDVARTAQIMRSGLAKLGLPDGDLNDARYRDLVATALHKQQAWANLVIRLIDARNAKGLSQAELADIAMMDTSAIGRFETLAHVPTIATFIRIAEALDVKIELKGITA